MNDRVSLSLEDAWSRLEAAVPAARPRIERVPVTEANGRVLAELVTARADSPPADNSAMDGFALNSKDVRTGQSLNVSQRIAAGTAPHALEPGTAARIFTGAVIPDGADSVVIQENCDFSDTQVTIREGLRAGANIRRRAGDISQGDVVVDAHTRLRPQEMGLILSAGVAEVAVYAPLRVGVIATGDELIDVTSLEGPDSGAPATGKIFESNSPMIAARLQDLGCVASRYRARDTKVDTISVLSRAIDENDMVLTIGGVSVGEEDHVQVALNHIGRTEFWKINIKPGKPFLFGTASGKPVMGLPGNPVSSFVTFHLFCTPFLQQLQGGRFTRPVRLPAVAGFSSDRVSDRVDHLRGRIVSYSPELVVEPVGTQSSSIQGALCAADVLIVIPVNTPVAVGQPLTVMLL